MESISYEGLPYLPCFFARGSTNYWVPDASRVGAGVVWMLGGDACVALLIVAFDQAVAANMVIVPGDACVVLLIVALPLLLLARSGTVEPRLVIFAGK